MRRILITAVLAGCGPDPDTTKRLEAVELQGKRLQAMIERLTRDAPAESDTLQKVAARHELLTTIINYQDSTKTNWWCGPFICLRDADMCQAIVNRDTKPGASPEECIGRRNVYCRGIGLPLLGDSKTEATEMRDMMTCHASFGDCVGFAREHGGACVGVE